ncbi:MAG TPA: hypothetical protein VND42_02470 [Candidatus Acidoferrales bacterium]|nr:hypothetical protein [Candidatus Acidoferrales bacterium]
MNEIERRKEAQNTSKHCKWCCQHRQSKIRTCIMLKGLRAVDGREQVT